MKILQSMYERGFVLVRLHDVAYEVTAEDGSRHFQEGDIMLPEGKKPFVMSQDDVCYYEYMDGDGFASRMIIGEDGKPTNEMKMDDGSVSVGSYDLVPLLDDFIKEHPDFSYRGAKACIAFTGYNGILGYRTDSAYNTDEYKAEHRISTLRKNAPTQQKSSSACATTVLKLPPTAGATATWVRSQWINSVKIPINGQMKSKR